MFRKRLYIFIGFCGLAFSVCTARLAYLQTGDRKDAAREKIRLSRIRSPMQLPTLRGGIYDRKNRELAVDKPRFSLQVNYQLLRLLDDKFVEASILSGLGKDHSNREEIERIFWEEHKDQFENLKKIIEKCVEKLGADRDELFAKIENINDRIWRTREWVAWKSEFKDTSALYKKKGDSTSYSQAMEDFDNLLEVKYKGNRRVQRSRRALKQNLKEMYGKFAVYDIDSDEHLVDVQMAFVEMEGVEIAPVCQRVYRYGPAACHIIGWVGPADPEEENILFPDDKYSMYIADEFSGQSGTESACEVILRGRRGEITYSRDDDEPVDRKETVFGTDVQLSIDIELQMKIENHLADKDVSPSPDSEIGAVVIDVASGDILAMVSIPLYDLNRIRESEYYASINTDPRIPFRNKAFYETYPPGSIIKPILMVIGLEEKKVTPREIINCQAKPAPKGWPNCLIYRDNGGSHNARWAGQGGNNGRNAIRGSCNIYFSRLADRLSAASLQEWLFRFGFGHRILPPPQYPELLAELERTKGTQNLNESNGIISSKMPKGRIKHIFDLPPINKYEKRRFGIGQASMRTTVLQIANAMAVMARRGIFKFPRLYINDSNDNRKEIDLGISKKNMDVALDGMWAVVNEEGGTGFKVFKTTYLREKNIKIYGKTGSTEKPANAWFAGFAEDISGRAVAMAIVIKKGKSGAKDAAPKARDIFEFCNQAGYIGIDPKRVK